MNKIAVIGGGITGVTTAYALVRRGLDVTLFEKHRYAAMETSYANGGQLSACNAEAWNHWPTIRKGLHWMFRDDAPLLLNPKPSWHKISWFCEFMAAIPGYRRNTTETARMAIAAREHLFGWAEEEGIDFDARHTGLLHVCRTKADFNHAAEVSKLLAAAGLERRAVTPEEIRTLEPTLAGDYYGGFHTDSDATGDIHKYANQLAAAAERRGATCLYGHHIRRLTTDGHRVTIKATHAGQPRTWVFDEVVVCAGTASRAFAAALGDRLNIYPVKGYSITVNLHDQASRDAAPAMSLVDDATKLVSSRLGDDRLRVAGSAEFNGFNHDIRADRIEPLIEWVERYFPGVSTRDVVPWAGLRPMMPDMMPRVGRGKAANVFYNTGHGHLGWTLSAATADTIAAIVGESR